MTNRLLLRNISAQFRKNLIAKRFVYCHSFSQSHYFAVNLAKLVHKRLADLAVSEVRMHTHHLCTFLDPPKRPPTIRLRLLCAVCMHSVILYTKWKSFFADCRAAVPAKRLKENESKSHLLFSVILQNGIVDGEQFSRISEWIVVMWELNGFANEPISANISVAFNFGHAFAESAEFLRPVSRRLAPCRTSDRTFRFKSDAEMVRQVTDSFIVHGGWLQGEHGRCFCRSGHALPHLLGIIVLKLKF